jgi:hypothetical protein
MAVVATMLAGLSSSEMTRAQYDRSLAAQQQSKAGDQWSFFQAKRLRGVLQRNTVDLLQMTTGARPFDPAQLRSTVEQALGALQPAASTEPQPAAAGQSPAELPVLLASPAGQQALSFLQRGELPPAGEIPTWDPRLRAALDGLDNLSSDAAMADLLARVDSETLEGAIRTVRDRVQAMDVATKPINAAIDQIESRLAQLAPGLSGPGSAAIGGGPPTRVAVFRDFTAARLRYAALRYEAEARLNQVIANLYELQVRQSNVSAQRHHTRSQRFFFGMLGAQLGVIVSTFAMAARRRNLLWSLAAAAGLVAVAFAVYVYLYV